LREVVPTTGVPTTVNTPLDDEPALLVSGRCLFFAPLEHPGQRFVVVDEDDTVIRKAYTTSPGLAPTDVLLRTAAWLKLLDLPHAMPQSRLVHYVWDLIGWNEETIVADAIRSGTPHVPLPAGPYHVVRPENVYLDEGASIDPGAVLDASRGPIVLGRAAHVGANAVLTGPCFIGPFSTVSPLSIIRPGVTIGTRCKVGGEIGSSIICSYSNKAHDGYLGDSYVGSWVNLGAGTVTSNLKNTYGQITMKIGAREVPTNRRFLGSIIGDHTKTAVGTRLNTGSYVGCCSSLAGQGLMPRFIPSFTFLTGRGAEPFKLDKAREIASAVYARRNRGWTGVDDDVLTHARETAANIEG